MSDNSGFRNALRRIRREALRRPGEATAPRCEACGLSYAQQALVVVRDETGGFGGRHEPKTEPGCEVCREPRRRWAQENGVTNEVALRVVYDDPIGEASEELGQRSLRDERGGHVDDEP
jgi:hypothetical protein